MLELGIGIIGLLILFGMPLVGGVYTAWAGSGVIGIVVRSIVAAHGGTVDVESTSGAGSRFTIRLPLA